MHVTLLLDRKLDDCVLARRHLEAGVKVLLLSFSHMGQTGRAGLVLGFAAFDETRSPEAVTRLKSVLE